MLRAIAINQINSSLMPTTFKCGCHPDVKDTHRLLLGKETFAQRKDIGVAVGTREARGFSIPAKTAADTSYTIGHDRFAISGAAEDDASIEFAPGDSLGGWPNEDRIVHRLR
jgi:hypothetical protein